MSQHHGGVAERTTDPPHGGRFAFGENWKKFLSIVDDERIAASERALCDMLGIDGPAGHTFLDIGSGSGLSSLAARRLGATVHSFDYDPGSVRSTNELRRRFFADDDKWTVKQGSVLDQDFMRSLGQFDIVYSWGVLHHTGNLWTALSRAADAVKPNGKLFVAIYNDNGLASRLWRAEKRLYVRSSGPIRLVMALMVGGMLELRYALGRVVRGGRTPPFKGWRQRKRYRGMSTWHDLVDWVGGYPFQFAKPGEVFTFLHARGFELEVLKTHPGSGANNEFVFHRAADLDKPNRARASRTARSRSVLSEGH